MNDTTAKLQERLEPEIRDFRDSCKTLLMATLNDDHQPNVSYAPFVLMENGYYILVSDIARHGQNLQVCPNVSIMLIADENDSRQIYARKRLTFDAVAEEIKRDTSQWSQVIEALSQRHGEIVVNLSQLGDFRLYRLMPKQGLYVKGFGQAYQVSGDDLVSFVHLKEGHQRKVS
ncbi:heme utilization protein HutZ [Nitrincola nitratireducens]|uniref:Pyridoxamine 5'-phosphate oxidase N-terminal domain-containing protein n=1 Tax=Nitrincola nitratireducens TaxID=1229521 RepID=W9V0D1_9GAMM|nr:heme utilization protein HutZ [Nitrincola nitratireducens]EXJ09602.1 hypothetical protein D791_03444 [Nitrincola nitratireducens]